jgi:dolichol-phosphate mannosyltransferase
MNKKDLELLVTVAASVDNDAAVVESFINEVYDNLSERYEFFEILLIDNHSTDESPQKIRELQKKISKIRFIRLTRRHDQEIVHTAALENSIGDFVVLMDVHYDPPSAISDFIEKCQSGFEVVTGLCRSRQDRSKLGMLLARAFYSFQRIATGYVIEPDATSFRVLSRKTVNSIIRIKDKVPSIKFFTEFVGFHHTYLEYQQINRLGLSRQRGFWDSLNFAVKTIVSNSDKPLRMVSMAGVLASSINLAYILFALVITIFQDLWQGVHTAEGWASTNVFNAVMFFLLFSMLAVLSEYVSRILNETQQRPLYYVALESQSSVIEEYEKTVNVV